MKNSGTTPAFCSFGSHEKSTLKFICRRKKRNILILGAGHVLAFILILASLCVGRFTVTPQEIGELIRSYFDHSIDASHQTKTVVENIRFPRVISAFLVGGALAVTGAAYQGIFRNPMVSPSILGVSAGAGFGAALAMVVGLGTFWIQGLSFAFGIVAVALAWSVSLSKGLGRDGCLSLILSGLIIGTILSALISVLKYVADPYDSLPSIVYWLMGGFSGIRIEHSIHLLMIVFPGLLIMWFHGRSIDLMSFGEEEARSMGVETERTKVILVTTATLMTSACVSVSGIIGWIGLMIPHIARQVVGPSNAILIPVSFMFGGTFLLLVDDISRSATSMEVPPGIITSLLGGIFFILIAGRSGWGRHD